MENNMISLCLIMRDCERRALRALATFSLDPIVRDLTTTLCGCFLLGKALRAISKGD
jgi:hypothetical protein